MSRNTATMKLANEVRYGTQDKQPRFHFVSHKDMVQKERNMIKMAEKLHLTRDQRLLARTLMNDDSDNDSLDHLVWSVSVKKKLSVFLEKLSSQFFPAFRYQDLSENAGFYAESFLSICPLFLLLKLCFFGPRAVPCLARRAGRYLAYFSIFSSGSLLTERMV